MSWLSDWFRRDATKRLIGLCLGILKMFIGRFAGELWGIAREEVIKAEAASEDGWKKWTLAYEGIVRRLGDRDIPEWLISIAIEVAVGVMKQESV